MSVSDPARELWIRAESIHAVTYFADESRAAARELGLRGFWMGYFAFRAAPLGPVGPDVVAAAFYNFAPAMVRRAIPDAWSCASPETIVARRAESATAAIRRVDSGAALARAVDAAPALLAAAAASPADDRPLFAANRALPLPDDPVAALWQATANLREHRGDGHVAALRSAGISGCQAHLLMAAERNIADDLLRDNRGWTEDEWRAERDLLVERGLLDRDGSLSAAGRQLRAAVEDETDRGAAAFVDDGDERAIRKLIDALDPLARAIAASDTIPYPNPMGLPRVDPANLRL